MMQSSLFVINHSSVSVEFMGIWPLEKFQNNSQGHQEYGKYYTMTPSIVFINPKSVSLVVTEIMQLNN